MYFQVLLVYQYLQIYLALQLLIASINQNYQRPDLPKQTQSLQDLHTTYTSQILVLRHFHGHFQPTQLQETSSFKIQHNLNSHQGHHQTQRGLVVDVLFWLECYSSLVAVLATKHLHHISDFMAYQRTIIKASKNFEGTAWVIYDCCYRRRAAPTKSLSEANIDSALYNEAFTSRGRVIHRCQSCLSENHTEAECPDRSLLIAGLPSRILFSLGVLTLETEVVDRYAYNGVPCTLVSANEIFNPQCYFLCIA